MAKPVTQVAPQVIFDVLCPNCKCDVIVPIMKLRYEKSFSGNKIRAEWPSRDEVDEFARVACPACWLVYTVRADGTYMKSSNHLPAKKAKRKTARV